MSINAEVIMISGCRDDQTSADVYDVGDFQLPDPAGRAGGACTSALLKILYNGGEASSDTYSYQELLLAMREVLEEDGYSQIPQLTSSQSLDITVPFSIVPEDLEGRRRAVLIGINYVGHDPGELSGCHNDVLNIKKYIMEVHGFEEEDITVLMDDGEHISPTRENILRAYQDIVAASEPGDAVFCHYSGHGGRIRDDNGDEEDGYDETLVPLDYSTEGQIRDDDLFVTLVHPMAEGVRMTCIMDCCHSATVLDLPYRFIADGDSEEMEENDRFNFDKYDAFIGIAAGIAMNLGGNLTQAAAGFLSNLMDEF